MQNLLLNGEYTDVPKEWGWDEVLAYVESVNPTNIRSWQTVASLGDRSPPDYLAMRGNCLFYYTDLPEGMVYRSPRATERIYDGDDLYEHIA